MSKVAELFLYLVYFGIIGPLHYISSIFGIDPFTPDNCRETYWMPAGKIEDKVREDF